MCVQPAPEDEHVLVERAKHDPEAFGELYDRYLPQIYRLVYSRVHSRVVAEDVTSEVFMKALKGIGRYRDMGKPLSAWLYQIAAWSVADCFRGARPVEDIDQHGDLAAAGPLLEDVAAERAELRRIWSAVDTLPTQQRIAMVLRFQEDMRTEDI